MKNRSKKAFLLITVVGVVLIANLLIAGCISPQPATTATSPTSPMTDKPSQVTIEPKIPVYTESNNGQSITMPKDTVFRITLDENPTTGFTWNATMTAGLTLADSGFIPKDSPPGMVGAGGTHYWVIKASGTGSQNFLATYARPWENVTGNETSFKMTFFVQ